MPSPSERGWLGPVAPSRCRPQQGLDAPSSSCLPCGASQERVCKKRLVVSADFSVWIGRGMMCNHNNCHLLDGGKS